MSVISKTQKSLDRAEQIISEYEDLVYIISHDLNAPLRHVSEFTRLLIAGRRDNLSEEEREYIEFLEQSLTKLDAWLFEVRDNGIGIDEKYVEDVFRLFKKLDIEKYPGVGAGLTMTYKIVQRHGGEMIIESKLCKGTSVFFSISKF